MRIAIDVMGGDHAPDAILDGCVAALEIIDPSDRLILVGDERAIKESLTEHGRLGDPRLEVVTSTQVIGMAEQPTVALRAKPDSSIAKWAWLGSRKAPPQQKADVIISAG